MPYCTACGVKNSDDARFCSACGHAIVTAVPAASAVAPAVAPAVASEPRAQNVEVQGNQNNAPSNSSSYSTPDMQKNTSFQTNGTAGKTGVALKAFDNPDELWKMYFYVSFFNIGVYCLTGSAADFLSESGGLLSLPVGVFVAAIVLFMGFAYWLIKKQAVDKSRSLWLLPLIAWHVYSYLDGLSGIDLMYAETSFDYYDIYISGVPETIILIRLFLALRERF